MMPLQLSTPSRNVRLLAPVELRPNKVEKWLTTLPLLNVVESGHKLYSTLNSYNRTDIDAAQRLELLEMYRAPIKHVGHALQRQYVGLPLPLPERNKNIAEQHREFYIELAHGYKQVVMAQADVARPKTIERAREIALPIQRAIRHLGEVLLTSHLAYSPAPPNIWKEIHELYKHAESLSVTAVPVEDPLNSARGRSTVADVYKHALLLDFADPHHLSSQLIAKIDQYLESTADLSLVRPAALPIESNCQFLIDLEGDRAGIVHSPTTQLDELERYRILNTFELARTIHGQLLQLQNGEAPQIAGLPGNFLQDGGQEMLVRLIHVWGVNPKRSFRRNERMNAKADVVIGLDAISYWLNGGRKLEPSSGTVGPEPDRASLGTFGEQQIISSASHDYSAWAIEDESAGGMSLSKSGGVRRRVRVGDLLATRLGADEPWTISVVRWVKSPNPSNVEIGVQRLAPTAQPVLIKAVAGDTEESDLLAALRLPAIPALKEPETLVIPANLFRADRTFYMDDGKLVQRVVTKQILESASGFDRAAFAAELR